MIMVTSGSGRTRARHAERQVREACADTRSPSELLDALRDPLGRGLGLAGMLVRATDPETTMFSTAAVIAGLPDEMCVPWMHNEFLEDDVNKFATLHRTSAPVSTVHRATQGRPRLSPRHATVNAPLGFGPELRTTFSGAGGCWGVLNLLREAGSKDFSDAELTWVEDLRGPITRALRRMVGPGGAREPENPLPGVVTLDPHGHVLSMTRNAIALLGELRDQTSYSVPETRLPCEAYSVALAVRAHRVGHDPAPRPLNRVRGVTGRWLTIRGDSTVSEDGELINIVLVVEPSRPAEIFPLAVAGFGLSARESEVLAELTAGRTTAEIAARLFISEHTVRDHVKSILTKTGCSSRAALVSTLFRQESCPGAVLPQR